MEQLAEMVADKLEKKQVCDKISGLFSVICGDFRNHFVWFVVFFFVLCFLVLREKAARK